MRVLLTGMSGTGKSAVVRELRRRGYAAYDADDDGYTEPAADGTWRWRLDAVAALWSTHDAEVLFFAGCSQEQTAFVWDRQLLLSAPQTVLVTRLQTRTSNDFGKTPTEMARILSDLREVEPLLRHRADAVIDVTQPLPTVVDQILAECQLTGQGRP